MGINGISTDYYSIGYTHNKAAKASTTKNFAEAVGNFQNTFQGTHLLVMGGLSSRGLIDGGCVTVYKAEEYSAANPIMRVVTRSADGQEYEQFIDPTKVNPTSATENEMSALLAYLVDEKKLNSIDTLGVGSGASIGTDTVSSAATKKKNFYDLTEEMMKMQYNCHNYVGYASYKKVLSAFDVLMNRG